jgi:hypothetical protein
MDNFLGFMLLHTMILILNYGLIIILYKEGDVKGAYVLIFLFAAINTCLFSRAFDVTGFEYIILYCLSLLSIFGIIAINYILKRIYINSNILKFTVCICSYFLVAIIPYVLC